METIPIDWQSEVPDSALKELVPQFHENRKKEVLTVEKLLKNKDFEGLRKMGHNWKGFSRPYGYLALEKMGIALEKSAIDEDLEGCQNLFEQFQTYLQKKEGQTNL